MSMYLYYYLYMDTDHVLTMAHETWWPAAPSPRRSAARLAAPSAGVHGPSPWRPSAEGSGAPKLRQFVYRVQNDL